MDISGLLLTENVSIEERLFFTKKSRESLIPDGAVRSDQYRFVVERGDTMLFDMKSDPGQKKDISSMEIELTNSLALEYKKWFDDVTGDFQPDTEIRIGFADEKKAYLPAHESGFTGDIHFKEGHGWAHDWLVNWINSEDSIYWDVVVDQPTEFSLELLYSCPIGNIGAVLEASNSENKLKAEIINSHDPEYFPSPDRIQRIEVYEKEWARLPMGNLNINSGNQRIVLKAKDIPNGMVGEIKGLQLTRVN